MSLNFTFCGIFLLPLWIKFRPFLVGVSCNKKVTLDKHCFFVSLKLFFFFKITSFLLLFYTEHFSARKCTLCQTMACTDKKSHNQKILLLSDNKFLKKERDACLRFCFSNPQSFGNVKMASQYIFTGDKISDNSPRCLSPALFLKFSAQWPKDFENFGNFQTKVS